MKKETLILNGESIELGTEKVISIGYNMSGNKIITKSTIHKEKNDKSDYYCINGGISILLFDDDLNGFYKDTKENRKLLKSKM